MNKKLAQRLARSIAAALCAGSLALVGCQAPPEAPLAGARIGGPFALTDQDGRAVTERAFAGKWRAIYFGYTFCPDVCPTNLQHLMQGYALFANSARAAAAKLRPIFVSVDPARDTPTVLKQYVAAFGPGLTGLTGSDAQIADMAKRYGVAYQSHKADGAAGYLVDHSSQTILFDQTGAPIALLPTDESGAAVAAELGKWVR